MMNDKQKAKLLGIAVAVLLHMLAVVFLWMMHIQVPRPQEEGGMELSLGNVAQAIGGGSFDLMEVQSADVTIPAQQSDPSMMEHTLSPELITDNDADAPPLDTQPSTQLEQSAKPKQTPRPAAKLSPTPKSVKTAHPVPTPEQLRAEAEAKARAEEETRRKAAEEAARRRVASAFGKGAQMEDDGNTPGRGSQGSLHEQNKNAASGNGGSGFDLKGRSLGPDGLPLPVYNVRTDAQVVVDITVNPAGEVVATGINMRGTDIQDAGLHRAAEAAARKARFNSVEGLNNQTGTITYRFKLK